MQKNPDKNKDAINETTKANKKKKKRVIEPRWNKGDKVVIKERMGNSLLYVQVVSIRKNYFCFTYYATILETTNKKFLEDIGEIVDFDENGSWLGFGYANVEYDNTKNKWRKHDDEIS